MDSSKFPANNRGPRNPQTPEKKQIEPSIDREPDVRKPTLSKKFFGSFIASDWASVKEYVIMEVLLPRGKSLLLDAMHRGAEMFIMGSANAGRSRNDYSRISSGGGSNRRYDDGGNGYNRRPMSTYVPYPEPIFETEEEALDVIDDMIEYVNEYPCVSISDFLGFCNRPKDNEYTYENYGWGAEIIRNCRPEQIPDGRFVIKLPKPRYLR